MNVHPGARISSQYELQQTPIFRRYDFNAVLDKKLVPPFRPPKDHLNCDPSLELEEMIVEAKPLHKKKKRLAKQRSIQKETDIESSLIKEFIIYNRYKEMKRRAMELKETEWEKELEIAMANSEVTTGGVLKTIEESQNEHQFAVPSSSNISMTTITINDDEEDDSSFGDDNAKSNNNNVIIESDKENKANRNKEAEIIDYIDRTPSPKSSA